MEKFQGKKEISEDSNRIVFKTVTHGWRFRVL